MSKRVIPRVDPRISDDTQLLVRFNDDHQPEMALRNALRDASLYRTLAAYAETGAITISVLIVRDALEARVLARGIEQDWYGLATVRDLRAVGLEVVATDIEEDGRLVPFSDRHADVIVAAYPAELPPYTDQLSRAQRKAIRTSQLPGYAEALRRFDPRHDTRGGLA